MCHQMCIRDRDVGGETVVVRVVASHQVGHNNPQRGSATQVTIDDTTDEQKQATLDRHSETF